MVGSVLIFLHKQLSRPLVWYETEKKKHAQMWATTMTVAKRRTILWMLVQLTSRVLTLRKLSLSSDGMYLESRYYTTVTAM